MNEQKYKVLLVDDEITITQGLSRLIDWAQYNCEIVGKASNGVNGFNMAMELQPHIIITDIRMPHMDGLQMIGQLKEENHPAKFIILSGYTEFSYAKKGIKYGVNDYLIKPIEEKLLEQCLLQLTTGLTNAQLEAIQSNQHLVSSIYHDLLNPAEDPLTHGLLEGLERAIKNYNLDEASRCIKELLRTGSQRFELFSDSFYSHYIHILVRSLKALTAEELRSLNVHWSTEDVLSLELFQSFHSLGDFENYLLDTIRRLIRCKRELQLQNGSAELIEQIKEYMALHFSENLTLYRLSNIFFLNPSYLSQYFKKKTKVSFVQYLTQLRMDYAMRQLAETEMTIEKICLDAGYTDIRYFRKIFKKLTKKTPHEYRKSLKKAL